MSHQRRDVQGMRALAVIMVIAFHAGLPVPGGFTGVDVFFVISGFVITGMLKREWAAHGRVSLRRFYVRRFKRLTPALALTVAVTMLLSAIVLSPLGTQQTTAAAGLGALFLAANIVIARTSGGYFDAPAESNALLNTWSLSVEEQFYLFFPLMLVIGWKLASATRRSSLPTILVGVIGAASFLAAILGSSGHQLPLPPKLVYLSSLVFGFYSPATRVWEFAVGALLAMADGQVHRYTKAASLAAGFTGLGLVAASLWVISDRTPFPGGWTLFPVVGTLLLLWSGRHRGNPVSRLLSCGPLVRIGDWSYSLYLWHWPMIVFSKALWPQSGVAVLLAAGCSIPAAIACYYLVEQPIRLMREPRGRRLAVLGFATLGPPMLLATLLGVSAERSFWIPKVREYQAAIRPDHAGQSAGCAAALPWTRLDDCMWNKSGKGPPIYLIGDSHADHFSEGVIEAGKSLDRPVLTFGVNGCSYSNLHRAEELCGRIFEGVTNFLGASTPGLVIISNVSADTGLQATTTDLQEAGHGVLLVQAVPMFVDWRPDSCSIPTIIRGSCSRSQSIQTAEARQEVSRQRVRTVSRKTQAAVLDVWPILCPAGDCSTQAGTLVRYRDSDHITVAQSRALEPAFLEAIEAASRTAPR